MKKLTLSRETIRKLDDVRLGNVKGGGASLDCDGRSGWESHTCCKAGKPDA